MEVYTYDKNDLVTYPGLPDRHTTHTSMRKTYVDRVARNKARQLARGGYTNLAISHRLKAS